MKVVQQQIAVCHMQSLIHEPHLTHAVYVGNTAESEALKQAVVKKDVSAEDSVRQRGF